MSVVGVTSLRELPPQSAVPARCSDRFPCSPFCTCGISPHRREFVFWGCPGNLAFVCGSAEATVPPLLYSCKLQVSSVRSGLFRIRTSPPRAGQTHGTHPKLRSLHAIPLHLAQPRRVLLGWASGGREIAIQPPLASGPCNYVVYDVFMCATCAHRKSAFRPERVCSKIAWRPSCRLKPQRGFRFAHWQSASTVLSKLLVELAEGCRCRIDDVPELSV